MLYGWNKLCQLLCIHEEFYPTRHNECNFLKALILFYFCYFQKYPHYRNKNTAPLLSLVQGSVHQERTVPEKFLHTQIITS
jgi:hypothetical protein